MQNTFVFIKLLMAFELRFDFTGAFFAFRQPLGAGEFI